MSVSKIQRLSALAMRPKSHDILRSSRRQVDSLRDDPAVIRELHLVASAGVGAPRIKRLFESLHLKASNATQEDVYGNEIRYLNRTRMPNIARLSRLAREPKRVEDWLRGLQEKAHETVKNRDFTSAFCCLRMMSVLLKDRDDRLQPTGTCRERLPNGILSDDLYFAQFQLVEDLHQAVCKNPNQFHPQDLHVLQDLVEELDLQLRVKTTRIFDYLCEPASLITMKSDDEYGQITQSLEQTILPPGQRQRFFARLPFHLKRIVQQFRIRSRGKSLGQMKTMELVEVLPLWCVDLVLRNKARETVRLRLVERDDLPGEIFEGQNPYLLFHWKSFDSKQAVCGEFSDLQKILIKCAAADEELPAHSEPGTLFAFLFLTPLLQSEGFEGYTRSFPIQGPWKNDKNLMIAREVLRMLSSYEKRRVLYRYHQTVIREGLVRKHEESQLLQALDRLFGEEVSKSINL